MSTRFRSHYVCSPFRGASEVLTHLGSSDSPYVVFVDWAAWFRIRSELHLSTEVRLFVVNGVAQTNWEVFASFASALNLPEDATSSYDSLGDRLYDGIWTEVFPNSRFLVVVEGADVMLENEVSDLDDPSSGSVLLGMFEECCEHLKRPFVFANGSVRPGVSVRFLMVESHA